MVLNAGQAPQDHLGVLLQNTPSLSVWPSLCLCPRTHTCFFSFWFFQAALWGTEVQPWAPAVCPSSVCLSYPPLSSLLGVGREKTAKLSDLKRGSALPSSASRRRDFEAWASETRHAPRMKVVTKPTPPSSGPSLQGEPVSRA